jgi:hypothetical protein
MLQRYEVLMKLDGRDRIGCDEVEETHHCMATTGYGYPFSVQLTWVLVREIFGGRLAFPRAMMQELVDVDGVGSDRNDALRGEEHYAALRGNEVLPLESVRSILSGVGVSIVVLAVFEISSTTAARSACSTNAAYNRAVSLRS